MAVDGTELGPSKPIAFGNIQYVLFDSMHFTIK